MGTLFEALMLILNVVWFVMIAHIIMSWLINFQVLNLRQPLVEDLLRDPQIAPLFAADKAAQQLVTGGEGRSKVRPMFSDAANQSEQPIRQKLKREGFWFR